MKAIAKQTAILTNAELAPLLNILIAPTSGQIERSIMGSLLKYSLKATQCRIFLLHRHKDAKFFYDVLPTEMVELEIKRDFETTLSEEGLACAGIGYAIKISYVGYMDGLEPEMDIAIESIITESLEYGDGNPPEEEWRQCIIALCNTFSELIINYKVEKSKDAIRNSPIGNMLNSIFR